MNCFKGYLLGQGSYGSVYYGHSPSGYPLAIKSSAIEASSSLKKEFRILNALVGCEGVVQILGECHSFERGMNMYNFVMEYAHGGTLSSFIKNRYGDKTPEPDVRKYTRMLLKGLSCIHERGFVHCDLKPDNVLVFINQDDSILVKLADFGLSKDPGEKCLEEDCKCRFRGTPLYMSPESVADGKIEAALDIWSLGCVVVEMLTGKKAWPFRGMKELFMELVMKKGPPKMPECLSEQGRDFLSKCFDVDPKRRWTAKMLLNHPFVAENFEAVRVIDDGSEAEEAEAVRVIDDGSGAEAVRVIYGSKAARVIDAPSSPSHTHCQERRTDDEGDNVDNQESRGVNDDAEFPKQYKRKQNSKHVSKAVKVKNNAAIMEQIRELQKENAANKRRRSKI